MRKSVYVLAMAGLAGVVMVMWLMSPVVSGQTTAQNNGGNSPTKTPWGDPDLQGMWTTWDVTPLEARSPEATPGAVSTRQGDGSGGNDNRRAPFVYQGQEYGFQGLGSGMGRQHTSPVSAARRSQVVDPDNGRIPVIPSKVQRDPTSREMQDSYENQSAWQRCIARGVPGRLLQGGDGRSTGGYNKAYELLQAPGYVVLFLEDIHETRTIPLDRRPHVGADIRLWSGDSRGHWEGNTLVVETTNFNGKGDGQGSVRQTEALRVVERFTRVDQQTLRYEVTFEDPNLYSRPWTAVQLHNLDPHYVIFEYGCHEGNGRYMETILGQGRFLDAQEAAQKSRP